MDRPADATTAGSNGLVLAGAAALGAYEVGVLSHLVEAVAGDVGDLDVSVVSGTSAGAINAMGFAAFADEPARGVRTLVRAWSELQLGQILRPSFIELLWMVADLAGAPRRLRWALRGRSIRGGMLAPTAIAELVARIPFPRISEHLATGQLRGVAVSATRVKTGEAVVFHQEAQVGPRWRSETNLVPVAARITGNHVLASAAIPLLFPPVEIDGELYCDGGLRQMVPLSPAIHLGADRLLVVNPLAAVPASGSSAALAMSVASPLYLAGKALNALFADRVEADLARLRRVTNLLRAGERRFGPSFARDINLERARAGEPELRVIDALAITPSVDLGALAADHVRSRTFASRVPGVIGWTLRWVADGEPRRMGDLLAYLLFDGSFTETLIDLGRRDARARHAELCAMFAPRALSAVG